MPLMKTREWMTLLLISTLIGGVLTAPVWNSRDAEEESASLELLFDPDPIKDHVSLFDDYGVKPMPPHLPPYLVNPYQPNLEDEYY